MNERGINGAPLYNFHVRMEQIFWNRFDLARRIRIESRTSVSIVSRDFSSTCDFSFFGEFDERCSRDK